MSRADAPTVLRETERKYDATSEQSLPSLSGLPGAAGDPHVDSVQLSALYYDTADHRLLAAGITLRRREGGEDAGWHLKIPAGGDTRSEWHSPGAEDETGNGDDVPEALVHLVRGVTRGHPIVPIALITTDRQRHRVVDTEGAPLVEVVSDVVVSAGGSGADEELVWREIEVEEAPDGHETADAIDARLCEAGFVRSAFPSKLSRAVGAAAPTADAAPGSGTPDARELLRRYVADHAQSLSTADLALRADPRASVHAFRVASRRVRSALQTSAKRLDLEAAAGPLVDELRWAGQKLGDARDIEVQWKRLVDRLDDLDDVPDREAVRARIDEYFSSLEATAREQIADTLDSARYLEFRDALDTFAAQLSTGVIGRTRPAKSVRKDLRRLTHSVDSRVRAVRRASDRTERDERIHRVRKGAKKLRYALELSRPYTGKNAKRAVRKLTGLQDLLGEHQDSVVAAEHLRVMSDSQDHSTIVGFGLGMVYRRELDLTDQLSSRVRSEWRTARKAARKIWR
ncbi:CYTH and CHAD domain-containing protein [Rhodococcus triatomae]|uniref:CHAD domain-containing protein n=1 Tax=Rhodococcus triatomae TaxID=300028 RepID=A0A1G8AZE8_9NOCA|nr:CYTH and CHAD domain-containing protein [Rhodococcus triatomae]QNG17628.1 CYTH and CHAD domain-containing protein [Rhodococcus triatomae]QNG22705.1 CYTH and CHAD domain-containing protein [Rhodococcus triatomae]SDH26382.1 CHAD domain-containing protein [Rhodococcus triatomae]